MWILKNIHWPWAQRHCSYLPDTDFFLAPQNLMCFLKYNLLNFFSVGKNIKEERQKNDLRKKRKENPRKKAVMFCVSTSQKKFWRDVWAFQISCHSGYEILIYRCGQLRLRVNEICWLAETGGASPPYFGFLLQLAPHCRLRQSFICCASYENVKVGRRSNGHVTEVY